MKLKGFRFALFILNVGLYAYYGFVANLIAGVFVGFTLAVDEFLDRTPEKPEEMPDED